METDDVIAVSTGSVPTYPVPNDVIVEAMQGVRWSNAYDTDVPGQYRDAAVLVASGAGLTTEQIVGLSRLNRAVDDGVTASARTGWNPGEDGYPSRQRILAALAGGSPLLIWAENIRSSLIDQTERTEQALLSSIEYDPGGEYHYFGMCAAGDPDIVTDVVRTDSRQWQRWMPGESSWQSVSRDVVIRHPAVEPDSSMLAAIVSAVGAGDKLRLVYAEPVMFLPEGAVATTFPDDVDDTVIAAVVDDIDTTAVWTAVRIDPGPVVSMRASGQWVSDIASDLSSRIVVLDEQSVEPVLAAVDAFSDGADSDVSAVPDTLTAGTAPADVPTAMDRIFARIIAAAGRERDDDDDEDDDYDSKTDRRREYRALVSDVETLRDWAVLKATRDLYADGLHRQETGTPVVAQALGGLDRNRGGAEHLRRYWTHGRGALKIRWGTEGDWRRCYRQLFKHMGPRAAGWCQLRHKEQTGMYTGNRLHRAGIPTIKAAAYSGDGGMIALVPSDADLDRLPISGGEDRSDLHLTLWFLGDADQYDAENRAKLIERVRMAVSSFPPIQARIFGFAHWNPDSDDPCWVWNVGDGEDLESLRDRIGRVWLGMDPVTPLPPPQHAPWVPHVTATFADPAPSGLTELAERVGPLTFDAVRVVFSQDVVDIPLKRDDPVSNGFYTVDEVRAIGLSVAERGQGVSR